MHKGGTSGGEECVQTRNCANVVRHCDLRRTVRKFFGAFAQAHAEPLEQLLASGTLKPQYVLTTLFSGDALQVYPANSLDTVRPLSTPTPDTGGKGHI